MFRHGGTFCTVKLMPDASVGALLRKYELKAKRNLVKLPCESQISRGYGVSSSFKE